MPKIERLVIQAFSIPTESPESDGTFEWDETTLVLVHISADGKTGLGYSYADISTAHFIDAHLKKLILGADALDIPLLWHRLVAAVRNLGRPGVASMAVAAVDTALWDLKAKLLRLPLLSLLGRARDGVPIYGSGGFTSYSVSQLQKQLGAWVACGVPRVKMKIGRDPESDLRRVEAAREAIGPEADLFVDANGAYRRKQALYFAERFQDLGVTWFEEPVSSDDLEGLRLICDRAPGGMDITAGEYGYDLSYFNRMLNAGAVDILQADITRCAGLTGFLEVASLCHARSIPLSSHCAPALHLAVCAAAPNVCHMEYFFDHVRIESLLFDGVQAPKNGMLFPDLSRPGHGLALKEKESQRYVVFGNNQD